MPNVVMYTTGICPYCFRAKSLLNHKGVAYTEIRIDGDPERFRLDGQGGHRSRAHQSRVRTRRGSDLVEPVFAVNHESPLGAELRQAAPLLAVVQKLAEAAGDGAGVLGVDPAGGAAGEEVVLVVEIDHRERGSLEDLGREIRQRIGRTLSLPVADLVFVRRGRIPKTTSGKVRRRELRDRYLRGELEKL